MTSGRLVLSISTVVDKWKQTDVRLVWHLRLKRSLAVHFPVRQKQGAFFWNKNILSHLYTNYCAALCWALRCKMVDIVQKLTRSQISRCWELPECLDCETPRGSKKYKSWDYIASLINAAWQGDGVGVIGEDMQIFLRVLSHCYFV